MILYISSVHVVFNFEYNYKVDCSYGTVSRVSVFIVFLYFVFLTLFLFVKQY